jgi:hypothetical protein
MLSPLAVSAHASEPDDPDIPDDPNIPDDAFDANEVAADMSLNAAAKKASAASRTKKKTPPPRQLERRLLPKSPRSSATWTRATSTPSATTSREPPITMRTVSAGGGHGPILLGGMVQAWVGQFVSSITLP